MPQSVGTDFDQAPGQDMTQKAADKFLGRQGGMLKLLGFAVAVIKGDLAVFKLLQPTVGNGDAKGITSQIVQNLFSTAGVLDLHVPFLWPDRRGDLVEESELFESGL